MSGAATGALYYLASIQLADGTLVVPMSILTLVLAAGVVYFGVSVRRHAHVVRTFGIKSLIIGVGMIVAKLSAFKGVVTLASAVQFLTQSYNWGILAAAVGFLVVGLYLIFEFEHQHHVDHLVEKASAPRA
ncbi:MAG: hypothetical protein KBE09_00260 [Candidatus Pacebacteria bacterium]|nr:hypothetical protein [Candidatus Paceibacterota bacterium]